MDCFLWYDSGMIIWGQDHKLIENVMSGSTYPGTWAGRVEMKDIYYAAYELNKAQSL